MALKIIYICCTFICFLTIYCQTVFSQQNKYRSVKDNQSYRYEITPLDATIQQPITIKMENSLQRRMKIFFHDDSISLHEMYGNLTVKKVNKNFLSIVYNSSSGTDCIVESLLLVCIKNNKIHVALDILYKSSFMSDTLNIEDYYAEIKDLKGIDDELKLNLFVHHFSKYPRKNYYNKSMVLLFDKEKDVFYNQQKFVDTAFAAFNDSDFDKIYTMNIEGTLPLITIDKDKYYYIDNVWYQEFKKDNDTTALFKMYYYY